MTTATTSRVYTPSAGVRSVPLPATTWLRCAPCAAWLHVGEEIDETLNAIDRFVARHRHEGHDQNLGFNVLTAG